MISAYEHDDEGIIRIDRFRRHSVGAIARLTEASRLNVHATATGPTLKGEYPGSLRQRSRSTSTGIIRPRLEKPELFGEELALDRIT